MNYFLASIFISLFSLFGIAALFFRSIKNIRNSQELLEKAEFLAKEPFLKGYPERAKLAVKNFIKRIVFHETTLKNSEIIIRRVRLLVLKLEIFLFRIIDYLNGRRRIHGKNGNSSDFLKDLDNSIKGGENSQNKNQ